MVKLDDVQNRLKKIPMHIKEKLFLWIQIVESFGIRQARWASKR